MVENTGGARLDCLATEAPDEAFAASTRAGVPESLYEQDFAVLTQ